MEASNRHPVQRRGPACPKRRLSSCPVMSW